jgi:hypothetical protein
MISMVKEHMYGLIKEYIQVLGRKIRCMGRVKLFGKMVEGILG